MTDRNKLIVGVRSDNPGAYAYIGINRGDDMFHLFAGGFFRAADELLANVVGGRGSPDVTIYPALYTFRHGVELALKQLVRYKAVVEPDGTNPKKPGHTLSKLWGRVRDFVEYLLERAEEPPEQPTLTLEEMDGVIAELEAIDLGGDAFRYPESNEGKRHLDDVEYIHLPQLRDVAGRVAYTLRYWLWSVEEEADWYRLYRLGLVKHSGPANAAE